MIGYASGPTTKRNVQALRDHGWRVVVTPSNPYPPMDFRYAIDNGEWGMRDLPLPHDFTAFTALVDRLGSASDWVVLPDIVGGGKDSLNLSVSWIPKLRGVKHLLLAVQDGMTPYDVGLVLRQNVRVGLFLGGTTEYKLREMYAWGCVAHAWKRWYHVGRVNTARRLRLCAEAGADSFDGTSATMYSCTLPLLDAASRFRSLLTPAQLMGVEVSA